MLGSYGYVHKARSLLPTSSTVGTNRYIVAIIIHKNSFQLSNDNDALIEGRDNDEKDAEAFVALKVL